MFMKYVVIIDTKHLDFPLPVLSPPVLPAYLPSGASLTLLLYFCDLRNCLLH